MNWLFILFLAYLLGSIPFGLILTRLAGLGDIRSIGSGNIGATNVLRTGNKKLAALVLLLDAGKGYLAVIAGKYYLEMSAIKMVPEAIGSIYIQFLAMVGLLAVIGHMYPIWLKFKGGKGVATAFGVILGMFPAICLAALALWLTVFMMTRISSLSALVSINAIPFIAWGTNGIIAFFPLFMMAWLVTWRHRANIERLLNGTESRFGKSP